MKKIVVIDTAASKTGALSVLQDFADYIRKNEHENEWYFITGAEGLIEETGNLHVIVLSDVKESRMKRLHFDHFSGAKFLSRFEPDVVFSLQNTMPAGKIKSRNGYAKKILYVHQPLGFQNAKRFSFLKKEERHYAVYQHLISNEIDGAIKASDKTIVQTEWMRDAVVKKTGVDKRKVLKILPDVEDTGVRFKGNPGGFTKFIFPSGAILYKNHQLIVDAVKLLNRQGIVNFEVKFTLERKDLGWLKGMIPPNIYFAGSMPREEVLAEYEDSVLLFPSYIETFGVPLAEARKSGTIVLAANTPFAREVLKGYDNAYFFSRFAPRTLAVLMKRVIEGDITAEPAEAAIGTEENAYGKIVRELLK